MGARFDIAYNLIYEFEGYYVNSPVDRGGETFMGISRRFHPNNRIWPIIDRMKSQPNFPRSLQSNEELRAIVRHTYKQLYWDTLNLDRVNHQGIANECLDISVLNGPGTAGRFLQRVLNIMNRNQRDFNNLIVDGVVGPITLRAVNSLNANDSKIVVRYLNVLQGNLFINLAEADHSQQLNIRGWAQRVNLNI